MDLILNTKETTKACLNFYLYKSQSKSTKEYFINVDFFFYVHKLKSIRLTFLGVV